LTGGVDNVSVIAIEDLLKFAKIGEGLEDSAQSTSQAACAKVWICDTKLVVYEHLRKTDDINSQVEKNIDKKKSTTRKKKSERTTQKRRQPAKSSSNKNEKQLNLIDGKEGNRRTKIEISTDNNDE